MPTIQFSLQDLCTLVGKKIKVDEIDDFASYGKGEFEGYDKDTDIVKVDFGDTNQPYLWSVEGFARLIQGIIGKKTGVPALPIEKSSDTVVVDKNIKKVRPFIAMFRASGKKIDDYLLKQMIQLQEKFCDTYGRRRRKVSIGIYSYDKVTFPLKYGLANGTTSFIPLGFDNEQTLFEILEHHPTGQKYAFTVAGMKDFPLLQDNAGKVLSFIPIINSNDSGRVEIGDEDFLIELTGTDEEATHLGLNIIAQAFADRGFTVSAVEVDYGDRKVSTPHLFTDTEKVDLQEASRMLGITVTEKMLKELLEKMRYSVSGTTVQVPHYRKDNLHHVDIVEDIGIMYGYDKIPTIPLMGYTTGGSHNIVEFIDKCREILVGFGFQEVLSAVLSHKELLYDKMHIKDFGTVEIKEFMSQSHSVLRTWITPILLDVLSKNKHHDYPQYVFEQGLVSVRKGKKIEDYERLSAVIAGPVVDYTKIRQILDALLNSFGIEYELTETEHDSFIPGRVVRVSVAGKGIAYIGEIHPKVLENFEIQMPTAALELNLTELYELIK